VDLFVDGDCYSYIFYADIDARLTMFPPLHVRDAQLLPLEGKLASDLAKNDGIPSAFKLRDGSWMKGCGYALPFSASAYTRTGNRRAEMELAFFNNFESLENITVRGSSA
jgi:hypothetical protein